MVNAGAEFLDDADALVAQYLIDCAVMLVSPAEATVGDLDEDLIAFERRCSSC